MENISTNEQQNYQLNFHGKGSEYFGVIIVNWFLTLITLGLYYPWAKARQLKYMYGAIALNNDRFAFLGTGQEMFIGFIKTLGILLIIFGQLFIFTWMQMPFVGIIVLYLGLFALVPLAIHGSYRYRMSRTSWRGIRFGYRGERNELILNYLKWTFFTVITLGIYGAWMAINLRRYVLGNVRLGTLKMNYDGDGGEFFWLNFKGYLLTILTLGIYSFWWKRDLFAYYVDNTSAEKDGETLRLTSTATGGGFFGLYFLNGIILVFTLGLGYAWVVTRTMNYVVSKIEIAGNVNLDSLAQTEDQYNNAMGEDMGDYLDLNFIM